MAERFADTLGAEQLARCRRIEAAGLASFSQAVTAFERGEAEQINDWNIALFERAARAAGRVEYAHLTVREED